MLKEQRKLDKYLDIIEKIHPYKWTYEMCWDWYAFGSNIQKPVTAFNVKLLADDYPIIMSSQLPENAGMDLSPWMADKIANEAFRHVNECLVDSDVVQLINERYGKNLPLFFSNTLFI